MKITKKDGKEIDVPDQLAEQIQAIAGQAIGEATATLTQTITETVQKSIGDGVSKSVQAAVEAAVKPISERVEKLGAAPANPANPNPTNPTNPTNPAADPNQPPAWFAGYAQKLDAIVGENEGAKKSAKVQATVKSYFDQHLPNLKGRDRLIQKAIAAGLDSEDGVEKFVDDWKADLEATGVKFDSLTAKPENEGGKTGTSDADAKRLEEIRSAPRPLATVRVNEAGVGNK